MKIQTSIKTQQTLNFLQLLKHLNTSDFFITALYSLQKVNNSLILNIFITQISNQTTKNDKV